MPLLVLLSLAAMLALRHGPEPGAPLVTNAAAGKILLCEKRQLPGKQHTLNPHAPPGEQRQEIIKVCVEVLPDGQRPSGPVNIITERKPGSIA